jgi:hypothetical protein|tara:strand:+ start:94 stop:294 length:201 start_codon:yes stop_codon:yes gene_type:complete
MVAKYFFGIAYKFGRPVVKGASKKFQKLFEKEYDETRAAGVSSSGAFKSAAEKINKTLKEFPKKSK